MLNRVESGELLALLQSIGIELPQDSELSFDDILKLLLPGSDLGTENVKAKRTEGKDSTSLPETALPPEIFRLLNLLAEGKASVGHKVEEGAPLPKQELNNQAQEVLSQPVQEVSEVSSENKSTERKTAPPTTEQDDGSVKGHPEQKEVLPSTKELKPIPNREAVITLSLEPKKKAGVKKLTAENKKRLAGIPTQVGGKSRVLTGNVQDKGAETEGQREQKPVRVEVRKEEVASEGRNGENVQRSPDEKPLDMELHGEDRNEGQSPDRSLKPKEVLDRGLETGHRDVRHQVRKEAVKGEVSADMRRDSPAHFPSVGERDRVEGEPVQVYHREQNHILQGRGEVKHINVRLEDAQLKFRFQNEFLNVDIKTGQDIQRHLSYLDVQRLSRNLESLGISLESLKINGSEITVKSSRNGKKNERFNIREEDGANEKVLHSSPDSPDLNLLL